MGCAQSSKHACACAMKLPSGPAYLWNPAGQPSSLYMLPSITHVEPAVTGIIVEFPKQRRPGGHSSHDPPMMYCADVHTRGEGVVGAGVVGCAQSSKHACACAMKLPSGPAYLWNPAGQPSSLYMLPSITHVEPAVTGIIVEFPKQRRPGGHSSHDPLMMYCDVAWHLAHSSSSFSWSDGQAKSSYSPVTLLIDQFPTTRRPFEHVSTSTTSGTITMPTWSSLSLKVSVVGEEKYRAP